MFERLFCGDRFIYDVLAQELLLPKAREPLGLVCQAAGDGQSYVDSNCQTRPISSATLDRNRRNVISANRSTTLAHWHIRSAHESASMWLLRIKGPRCNQTN